MHLIDAIGAFLNVTFNVLFWTLTLSQRSVSARAKAYFWWSLFIALWSIGYGITLAGFFNYDATLIWNRYCQAMATMIGPFFFRFGCEVVDQLPSYKKIFKYYVIFGVLNALGMFFTPYYVKGLWSFGSYKFQPDGGPLYLLFTSFFMWCTLHSFFVVAKNYKQVSGILKKQVQLFLWATGIAYFGGGTLFLQGLHIPFPTTGVYLILAYVIIMGYSVHKYHFMEIPALVRRTIVFAGLVAFVFGVFSAATFLVREVLNVYLGLGNIWTYVISIFLIVLGYDPIRNLMVDLTDRFLFQRKYDYQKLLKDASKGISKIESLNHLFSLVTHFITMRMRVTSAAILTKLKEGDQFSLEYQRGYKKTYYSYYAEQSSPLIQYLNREKEPVDVEKVNNFIHEGGANRKDNSESDYDYIAIKGQMEGLEAAVCVPSFLGNELRNVLVIGPKKSNDYYSDEDLNVLFTLAQESAIAIENARLYDEAIKKTYELEKINEQLEGAKSQLIEALRETEAANKQLQDTQAQLIHEQKMATLGRLAASVGHEVNNPLTILSMNVSRAILKFRKNPDLKVSDILDVFQKMEQNISRIKAVVNTLTGLLKKSEKGKFEPLSLKLILEETLPLVQFQTYLDNLAGTEVEFNIPANAPLVRGDLERLQEVFLNLFINAYHAMAGRRNPRILVKAELLPDNPNMIAVYFTDNGMGMDEETMKKIFNYGFTTKPPGKGSGLGLYMCKYIIELHGGDIRVTSTPGVGTTFILTLPVYNEENITGNQPQMGTA